MINFLKERSKKHISLIKNFDESFYNQFEKLCLFSSKSLRSNGKIISFGNGGSASDSIHFTAELVSQYKKKRESLPSVSLNSNISTITSIANDDDYKRIFTRQLESLYNETDFIICLTTSGNSSNILNSIEFLNKLNADYFLLTGDDGGKCGKISKNTLNVNSNEVDLIQEIHYMILHSLCDYLEENLF